MELCLKSAPYPGFDVYWDLMGTAFGLCKGLRQIVSGTAPTVGEGKQLQFCINHP